MMYKVQVILKKFHEILFKLRKRDFFYFILSSTLARSMTFLSIIFLARLMSKYDYGVLSYVDNLRNYVLLLSGLGMTNVILRYCAQTTDISVSKGYFLSAFMIGLLFNIILVLISIVFYIYFPITFENGTSLLIVMSLLPVFIYIFDCIQIIFRANFQNVIYSKLSIIYSFSMIVLQIAFCIYWGLFGIAASRYIACIIAIVTAFFYYKNSVFYKVTANLISKSEIKAMIYLGVALLTANSASAIMAYNETYLLGNIIEDAMLLADYKIGSIFMQITYFVVTSINLFTFPIFANHVSDKSWVWNHYKSMTKVMLAFMLPLHILLVVFTPQLITAIFGIEYLSAVTITRILLISSFIQTVWRIPLGNILVAVNKEKINLYINIISMVGHFGLNILFLKLLGSGGIGYAIALVYAISTVFMLKNLRKFCMNKEEFE